MTTIELMPAGAASAAWCIGDVCAPLTREAVSEAGAAGLAVVLKALADPVRLRLVSMIAAHEGGEACVCDLTEPLGLSRPTVSHHLNALIEAGFLTRSKRGTWAFYALVPGSLAAACSRIAAAAGTFLLPVGLQTIGIGACTVIAAVACVIGALVAQRMAPETTGRTLHDTSTAPLSAVPVPTP